ncbi:hypothetical protein SAMN06295945_0644 [Polynucleobacter meluiroseus]|uniref:Uncharacterized protein n=1 Tax=Polynucleobacter meluiroseus TaxID=1938814 RepID=A0A240DZC1_9BURK|nr:hypothetical protein [Polynucleobacter meluiroseus]SNX28317.1 hypothetical protein SAMN06295945_0644 [Polynucleobacter meluiroseus]
MQVQMIELEDLQLLDVSDEKLEAGAIGAGTSLPFATLSNCTIYH